MAPLVVMMGVSGSGKSTVGVGVAQALGVPFQEGDDFHDAASVERMKAGQPLDDAARAPWLVRIAAWLDRQLASGPDSRGGVVTCSALRRAARDALRADRPDVKLVYLAVSEPVLRERLQQRRHAFMPASLLSSQLEALMPPVPEEDVLRVDGDGSLEETVQAVLDALAAVSSS